MALDLVEMLRKKPILGEYGAFNRPFVILDIDEYRAVLAELQAKNSRRPRKVPLDAVREA